MGKEILVPLMNVTLISKKLELFNSVERQIIKLKANKKDYDEFFKHFSNHFKGTLSSDNNSSEDVTFEIIHNQSNNYYIPPYDIIDRYAITEHPFSFKFL